MFAKNPNARLTFRKIENVIVLRIQNHTLFKPTIKQFNDEIQYYNILDIAEIYQDQYLCMQFAIKSNFDTIFKSYEVNNEDNHIGKLEVNEICGDCISKA